MKQRVTSEDRLRWMRTLVGDGAAKEVVSRIQEEKPDTIETYNSTEYMAVCDFAKTGAVIIAGMKCAAKGDNATHIFFLRYPDPNARTQRVFDL